MKKTRCGWAGDNKIYIDYHDNEWGRPVFDDRKLFEMLCLDGAQAGLSWLTILKKRENYQQAFDGFDPEKIVNYDDQKIDQLMNNAGIVRNRLKILSVVSNAKAFLKIQKEYHSFSKFLWAYVDNKPIVGNFKNMSDVPAKTPLSDKLSADLKKLGFKFVGSTIVYAFLQAAGLVNDHTTDCFVFHELCEKEH